jgi:putative ABC transport system permease protein
LAGCWKEREVLWRDFLLRARALFHKRGVERELDEELRSHLELQTRKYIGAGMAAGEAKRRARAAFGAVETIKDQCRDERRVAVFDHLVQDIGYSLRQLRRDRGMATVAAITLAVSIGATTTVFSLVNSILLRPLPYPNSDRVQWISERGGPNNLEAGLGPDYYSLRKENHVFENIAAYQPLPLNWTGIAKAEQIDAAQVTPSFFRVLGTQPLFGRYISPAEADPHMHQIVVLSYAFWRDKLGGDTGILGKSLTLDRAPWTVIGVMPQGFDYPKGTDVWRALDMTEKSQLPRSMFRPMRIVDMIARIKPGITRARLDNEMAELTKSIRADYPKEFITSGFLKGMSIRAVPLQRRITGDLRPALMMLTGAVILVLLIACANLANLLLARGTARQRELAVRMALGSGRARVVKQVLTESFVFALPGGMAGFALAYSAVATLNIWKPSLLDRYPEVSLDLKTLVFTMAVTCLVGVLFGLMPAFAATAINIQEWLKAANPGQSGGRRGTRLRRGLVIAELGMSVLLMIGAGLLVTSFVKLAHVDLGFQDKNLVTMRVNLVGGPYRSAISQQQFYRAVLERIRRLPFVTNAAIATDVPLANEHAYAGLWIQVFGRAPVPMAQRPETGVSVVSREFFQTLGIRIRSGRTFNFTDTEKSPDAIVINEAFARKIFPGQNPLGERIVTPNNAKWTIVGVVGDVRSSALGAEPAPLIYRCNCETQDRNLTRMTFLVRTNIRPKPVMKDLEDQIYAIDRNQPVFGVNTMEQLVADSLAPQRFHLMLLGSFTLIALVLAAVGVYGVMSYLVARRAREIGIRIALGARRAQVLSTVMLETLILAAGGVVFGLAGAAGVTRYLKSMLYGTAPLDAGTFVMAPLLLLAVALGAALRPALRAARTDPAIVLREE